MNLESAISDATYGMRLTIEELEKRIERLEKDLEELSNWIHRTADDD